MGKKIGWRPYRARLITCALVAFSLAAASSSAVAQFASVSVPSGRILYSCSSGTATNLFPTQDVTTIGDGDNSITANDQGATVCGSFLGSILGNAQLFKIGMANLRARVDNDPADEDEHPESAAASTLSTVSFLEGIVQYSSRNLNALCGSLGGLVLCDNEVTFTGLTIAGDSKQINRTDAVTTYSINDYPVAASPGLCGGLPIYSVTFTGNVTLNTYTVSSKVLTYTPLKLTGTLACKLLSSNIGIKFVTVDIRDVVVFTANTAVFPNVATKHLTAN